jgi:hypothetical protein
MNKMVSRYNVDSRTLEDIQRQIGMLAASYTPEWLFNPGHSENDSEVPDIGSVIALIFSEQTADVIERLNRLPEKYRIEFVNMLNIGLLPACPAQGVVVMELIQGAGAANVHAGIKLLGDNEDGETTVFETLHHIHVTNSRLVSLLAISPKQGKIIPLLGDAKATPLIPCKTIVDIITESSEFEPFLLFDSGGESIAQNALMMYHPSVFDTYENMDLSVRIKAADGSDLSEIFSDAKQFNWSYYDGERLTPFDDVTVSAQAVHLIRNDKDGESIPMGRIMLEGEHGGLLAICLQAKSAVPHSIDISTLQVSSDCENAVPTFVSHNEDEMDVDKFMPFGETASIYDEFYIGHDAIFKQKGSVITLRFELGYSEKFTSLTPEQSDEQLKVIKRKPRQVLFDTVRTCIERVSFEYFNGVGFKRLVFVAFNPPANEQSSLHCGSRAAFTDHEDWSTIFDGRLHGQIEMSFICPDDWSPITIGGNAERVIRVRVNQADNCYLKPCIHNMPVISDLSISYSYAGQWKFPQRLRVIRGTDVRDVTTLLLSGGGFTAFEPLPYDSDALYMGFDRKIEGSPVSLFFEVEESMPIPGSRLKFEYSTLKGFAKLQVRDNTRNLSNSGTIMFTLGSDFAQTNIEGQKRYWIRVTRTFEEEVKSQSGRKPRILRILPNAVMVHNVRTMAEEAFYIETSAANMSFTLGASNILSAEVYVNEKGLSHPAKQKLLSEESGSKSSDSLHLRTEYDGLGRITDFYVLWSEVENFDNSKAGDRHYVLDRMNNSILFGDGVNVRIPAVTDSTAFTVTARCCDGAKGNLPAGSINAAMGNILFIDKVYNPVAAYGGSNIESTEQAIRRGSNIINSKNRLISELDFEREASSFSDMVVQAKCVIGVRPDSKLRKSAVSLAVLTRDYADGFYSFESIKEPLKNRLLSKREATLTADDLFVTEPQYVTISADIWVQGTPQSRNTVSFRTQNIILERVKAFIDPLESSARIGELPCIHQFRFMLNSINCDAVIRHFSVNCVYNDLSGSHERELSALKPSPFMVGINGEHRIHIL